MTQPKKAAMLAAIAKTGNITQAAKAAKIERKSHYRWIEEDPEYAAAAEEAMQEAADLLEAEAQRRAVTGTLEPVFHQGKKVATVRKYSDTLLIFLLKGAKPEKYQERVKHNFGDLSDEEIIARTTSALAGIFASLPGGTATAANNRDESGTDRGGDSE